MEVSREIKELLYEYDCVIIPELGGFVTNYRPARLEPARSIIHPPGKDVSFNQQLYKSDGLLTSYIAEKEAIDFQKAGDLIKTEVEEFYSRLNDGQPVEFARVGILYFDHKKSLRFQPFNEVNYLSGAYGLQSVYAPEIARQARSVQETQSQPAKETPVIAMNNDKKTTPSGDSANKQADDSSLKRKGAAVYWAAAIALLIVGYIGFVLWRTDFKKPARLTAADLNPFRPVETRIYKPSKTVSLLPRLEATKINTPEAGERWSLEKAKPVKRGGVIVQFSKREANKVGSEDKEAPGNTHKSGFHKRNNPTAAAAKYRYHIIGGCFAEKDNAARYLQDLKAKGFPAYYLDKRNGLHRISMGGYRSRSKALRDLKTIKGGRNNSAWLVHR